MRKLCQDLFRPTLLKAFADEVLAIRKEASCIRFHDTNLLKDIVEREDDSDCCNVMNLMQLYHHVSVVLN